MFSYSFSGYFIGQRPPIHFIKILIIFFVSLKLTLVIDINNKGERNENKKEDREIIDVSFLLPYENSIR